MRRGNFKKTVKKLTFAVIEQTWQSCNSYKNCQVKSTYIAVLEFIFQNLKTVFISLFLYINFYYSAVTYTFKFHKVVLYIIEEPFKKLRNRILSWFHSNQLFVVPQVVCGKYQSLLHSLQLQLYFSIDYFHTFQYFFILHKYEYMRSNHKVPGLCELHCNQSWQRRAVGGTVLT